MHSAHTHTIKIVSRITVVISLKTKLENLPHQWNIRDRFSNEGGEGEEEEGADEEKPFTRNPLSELDKIRGTPTTEWIPPSKCTDAHNVSGRVCGISMVNDEASVEVTST